MKKVLIVILCATLFTSMSGCSNIENSQIKTTISTSDTGYISSANTPDSEVETAYNTDELREKALNILESMSNDTRIEDFITAYELMMSLPRDLDSFVSQIKKINRIYEKYDVEFKYGEYYLLKKGTFDDSQKGIDEYRTNYVYSDIAILLRKIVYPALFEKYGYDAECIKGLNASRVISAIKSTGSYTLDSKEDKYNLSEEKWKYNGIGGGNYEVSYHSNELVAGITIPIIRSNTPINDDDFLAVAEAPPDEQKRIASNRFSDMIAQFSSYTIGYEVLCQIYSDEELNIIYNYIKSLSADDIWERNLLRLDNDNIEPSSYYFAVVCFEYKGNTISIDFNLNNIDLRIYGRNRINEFSSKWETLYCGLCLSDGNDEYISGYDDYFNCRTEKNNESFEWCYNLDENEEKYVDNGMLPSDTTDTSNTYGEINEYNNLETNVITESNNTDSQSYHYDIDTEYYTISVPSSWETECEYEIEKGDKYSYAIKFYDKTSRKAYEYNDYGGWLFTIHLINYNEKYSEYADYDIIGNLEVDEFSNNVIATYLYRVIVTYPTDVNFPDETAKKYSEMKNAIPEIIESISFKDNCRFTNSPLSNANLDSDLQLKFILELMEYMQYNCSSTYTEWWENPKLRISPVNHYYIGKITEENYNKELEEAKLQIDHLYRIAGVERMSNKYITLKIGLYIMENDDMYFCYSM